MITAKEEEEEDDRNSSAASLDRAVAEIDVLESIYGCDDDEQSASSFRVISKDALEAARRILEETEPNNDRGIPIPRLDVVLQIQLLENSTPAFIITDNDNDNDDDANKCYKPASLHFGMPPGYPNDYPIIVSTSIPSLTRTNQNKLNEELRQYADALVGEEAILALVQKLQEIGPAVLELRHISSSSSSSNQNSHDTVSKRMTPLIFSRQWLFMDHIKAERRRSQMIKEAKDYQVGGYIKPGYPGVCVLEGCQSQLEDYVDWIRSIWIGRVAVRGEVVITSSSDACGIGVGGDNDDTNTNSDTNLRERIDAMRKLPKELTDLGNAKQLPNMGVLGSVCRTAGLEGEFLEYIMQIRGGGGG